MLRLHLSRALLAAGIACSICAMLPVAVSFIIIQFGGHAPAAADYLGSLLMRLPKILCFYAALFLLVLSVPLAILWNYTPSRRMLSVPWMAGVCGGCLGILLSPAWYIGVFALHGAFFRMSLSSYLGTTHNLLPYTTITGALYFFLHSFFIRQALGRKAWQETRM
ncbi:MAG: hypothetical protein KF712_04575 [Akkermansiaceae bacterium]|nr:hypothetical protein [Akkermansiaceae bacterium]